MEWTPARIRVLRAEGLCLSQDKFATALGFTKRTVGNAERGTHPPSLALRRALDQAWEKASDDQRDRFLAALATAQTPIQMTPTSPDRGHRLAPTLDGLRGTVLGWPRTVPMEGSANSAQEMVETTACAGATTMAAITQVHRRYQLADYDSAAQLLPAVLMRLQGQLGAHEGNGECRVGTLTSRHMTTAAYIAAAKLATKLGDSGLAWVTADRAITAANESEHAAARRDDNTTAQAALGKAGQLAEQLGCDGNWLWTAFGPTNVAIHQLSVHARLGSAKQAMELGATIDTDGLPTVLRGRRSRVHLELSWAAAKQADDALAVLHLLEAERVAEQAVSRNASARKLLSILVKRERRGATPGLRGLAARAGLLQ